MSEAAEELLGKHVELTRRCTCRSNVFKPGIVMTVFKIVDIDGCEGILLRDPRRPDISLLLGPSEYKFCVLIQNQGSCFNCKKQMISRDGETCPSCGKKMWELIALKVKAQKEG